MINLFCLLLALTLPSVGDARNLDFDPTVRSAYAAKWAAWSRIYDRYADWRGDAFPLPERPLRIAAEFRAGNAPDFLFLRGVGFDGIVLLVDAMEEPTDAVRSIHAAHGAGLLVFVAWCPPRESLEATVFPDPARLGAILRRTGAAADALIVGWRRTSIHLLQQDRAYSAFLIASARADRPDLPVIGEIYTGETAAGYSRADNPALQIPPEASAAIAVNYVIPRIVPAGAAAELSAIPGRKLLLVDGPFQLLIPAFRAVGFQDFITIIQKEKNR